MKKKHVEKRWKLQNRFYAKSRIDQFFAYLDHVEEWSISMKIGNGGGSTPIDLHRMKGLEKISKSDASSSAKSVRSDRVSAQVSQTLRDTVEKIESLGLTAGEIHSNVDASRAQGLLRSMEVEAKRPKVNNDDLLMMADRVSALMAENPSQASDAFKDIDPTRVADLL